MVFPTRVLRHVAPLLPAILASSAVLGASYRPLPDDVLVRRSPVIVLATVADGRVSLVAGVTPDLTGQIKAGELVNMVAQQIGGKGGGRPDMAQAGGNQPENLAQALAAVPAWVEQRR